MASGPQLRIVLGSRRGWGLRSSQATFSSELLGIKLDYNAFRRLRCFWFPGGFLVKLTNGSWLWLLANIEIEQQSWGWFAATRLIWKKCHKKWPQRWTTFENTMIHDVFWKAAETFHLVCHPKIYTKNDYDSSTGHPFVNKQTSQQKKTNDHRFLNCAMPPIDTHLNQTYHHPTWHISSMGNRALTQIKVWWGDAKRHPGAWCKQSTCCLTQRRVPWEFVFFFGEFLDGWTGGLNFFWGKNGEKVFLK